MQLSYWKKRWQEDNIGWHREDVDPDLKDFTQQKTTQHPNPVLIPLCGKTLDIDHLVHKGFSVEGVDVSSIALKAVIERHQIPWKQTPLDYAIKWQTDHLTLWQANFFDWAKVTTAKYGWIWDRAAFVAIKPNLRKTYLEAMANLLIQPGGQMICKTFEYDKTLSTSPPYSVSDADMHTLCGSLFTPTIIQKTTSDVDAGTLHRRGAKKVTTTVWNLSVMALTKTV